MEPDEAFKGNLGALIAHMEASMDDCAITAVRTAIAMMLTYGIAKFDTKMIPDLTNGEVELHLHNGPDGTSWSVEIVNMADLRGTLQ